MTIKTVRKKSSQTSRKRYFSWFQVSFCDPDLWACLRLFDALGGAVLLNIESGMWTHSQLKFLSRFAYRRMEAQLTWALDRVRSQNMLAAS